MRVPIASSLLVALCACASRAPSAPVAPTQWPAADVPAADVPSADVPTDAPQAPAEGQVLRGVRAIEVNAYGECALLDDLTVVCWDGDEHLWAPAGNLAPGLRSSLTPVPGVRAPTSICLSANLFCATREGGEVFCRALLRGGSESEGEPFEPVVVEATLPGLRAREVRSAQAYCAVTLRDGRQQQINPPVEPSAQWTLTPFAPLAQDCELRDGAPRCVGPNGGGLLANTTTPAYTPASPSALFGLRGVRDVAFGNHHGCAVLADGTVRCWGRNLHGQLGTGNTRSRAVPTQVPGIDDARAVRASMNHTCVVRGAGEVWCWGSATNGVFGPGEGESHTSPARVPGVDEVTDLRLNYSRSCALRRDGTVWCWAARVRRVGGELVSESRPQPVRHLL